MAHISDGKDLGYKEVGIYIIRTVYRTDGNDYVLLKNGKNFEILDFDDFEKLVTKSIDLLKTKSDEELYLYLSRLLKWYDETYLYKKNHKTTFTKRE